MHILALTQVLPYPLDTGSKVRAYYVLRHLARQHEVTLVAFVRPTDTQAAIDHISTFCAAVHTVAIPRSAVRNAFYLAQSLVTGHAFMVTRNWIGAMVAKVEEVARSARFDVIHADQLAMAPYALLAKQRMSGPPPLLVLDQHDAVSLLPARLADHESNLLKRTLLHREARKMGAHEARMCRAFDRVVWVTRADYEAVRRHGESIGSSEFDDTVIPISIDVSGSPLVTRRETLPPRLLFLGGLHYPPNAEGILWFAQQVLPRVLAQMPECKLSIIGKDPPQPVQELARALPAASVEITGYVRELTPYLQRTSVFLVPLLAGSGMRVKILDAWNWGLPVVSTSLGAEGLAARDGENLLLADTPEAFAEAVLRVLRDPDLSRRLIAGGRHTVETTYNWRIAYRAWDQVYGDLASSPHPPAPNPHGGAS